jgi:hypothetical protein
MNSYVPMKWKQYINKKPNVRKKLRNGLQYRLRSGEINKINELK